MSVYNRNSELSLSSDEFNFIFNYQLANNALLKKLMIIRTELVAKRPNYKRVNITLNLSDLDALIVKVSNEANKNNNSVNNQALLDGLFSKLSRKYNEAVTC